MRNMTVALLSGTALAVFACGPSIAQQAPTTGGGDSASSDMLETVVVTAQRREENIQKAPVSVTAISGEQLRTQRIQTAEDLQYLAPSLNVSSSVNRDDNTFVIRGQGPTLPSSASVAGGGGTGVVAYFADTVANGAGPGLYYDLESVQVVNGPQGTLFGKNTTGGVVLFTPRKPTNNFEGYAEIGAGDYSMKSIDAAVNIPIIADKLLVRIAGEGYLRDGFTIDRGPLFTGKDYDNRNYWTARATILFRPTESIENETIVDILRSQENGNGRVISAVNPTSAAAPLLVPFFSQQQAAGIRSTALSTNEFQKNHNQGIINTTRWFINDNITFKNIFSYKETRSTDATDNDGSPYALADLRGAQNYPWHLQHGAYTEEAQLQGTSFGGDLAWTTGGYFGYNHSIGKQPYDQIAGLTFELVQPDGKDASRSYGIYVQTTYDLGNIAESVRGLKLTTGYRYTWDYYSYGLALYVPSLGNLCYASLLGAPLTAYPASNCAIDGKGKSSAQSWTLGLDYQVTDNVLAYVRSARGYLPGGFNPGILDTSLPQYKFHPESVINVEVGVKSQFTLAGMPSQLNVDVFHSDFNDMQRPVTEILPGGVGAGFFTNAAEAEIYGLELQGMIVPFHGAKLSVVYSYNNGYYTKIDPAAAPSLVGIPFATLPKHKVNVSGSYSLPFPESVGDVNVSASYSYQSKFFSAQAVQPQDYIEDYGLLNLGVHWDGIMSTSWDASFTMTNATNNDYRIGQGMGYVGDGEIVSMYGEPRMFMFKLRYSFGPGFN